MRTLYRNPCVAIVVWTAIASIAWGIQAATGAADSKQPTDGLPNAQGSTLAVFKEAPSPASKKADPLDWPMWRGPEQNGISRETGLPAKFDLQNGDKVLWKSEEAAGISTPVIMHGRLYTMVRHAPETRREQEKVLCLDAATGEKLWESRHNVYLSGVPAERVGWSCVAADPETDRVYAQGVNGYFQCLDGATGKEIWSRSMHEEFGLLSTYGGRTNTPIVFEDLIIVHSVVVGWGDAAIPAHRFIAMDKNTGEVRWFNGTGLRPEDTTYATPVISVLGGEVAMVFGSCDGAVWAFQPRTGRPLWKYQMSRRGINTTPVVEGDIVYACQGEETLDNRTMGSVAAINGVVERGGKSGEVPQAKAKWLVKGIAAGKASPIVVDGRVYIADDGANLFILDAESGKAIGPRVKLFGRLLNSSPVWADGRLYSMASQSINIVEPTEKGGKLAFKQRFQNAEFDIIIGSPAISHGKIYLPTPIGLFCIGEKDAKPQATDRPSPPKEEPAGKNDQPAWVQVVPNEILLRPGEKQQFTARLFNDRGQFLKESEAEYSLAGPGEVSGDGTYTAASGSNHTATIVTAQVGDLSGKARIRVIPPLPWAFDFENIKLAEDQKTKRVEGEPPLTWVGARYRHKVRDVDGQRVMVKVTYIPKGTRSQMWMGHADLHDYTIQADLKGSQEDNQLPDMGVIAQRYTLDMMGQSQKLQIRSWPPQVATHLGKEERFGWEPNVWYTVKFRASTQGSGDERRVLLQGKVWPRGESEPSKWSIEAVDETPNLVGSPGFYGDATNAEVYIDNVRVAANESAQASAAKPAAGAQ
jgi:outer membrane protein assembly factor BamB